MKQGPGKRVLVVEDEALFRNTVVEGINTLVRGAHAVGAEDGYEALRHLASGGFSLVITDLKMPRLDGILLLKEMLNRRLNLPVLVVTAHATPEVSRWVVSRGAFEIFEKPIVLAELLASVQTIVDTSARSHIVGFSLGGLCQLLQLERKTCEVRVQAGSLGGRLVFREGQLLDAVHMDAEGDAAVLDILTWSEPTVDVIGWLPPGTKPRVTHEFSFLLMEAFRLLDERSEGAGPRKRTLTPCVGFPAASAVAPRPSLAAKAWSAPHAAITECFRELLPLPGFLSAAVVSLGAHEVLAETGAEHSGLADLVAALAKGFPVGAPTLEDPAHVSAGHFAEEIITTTVEEFHLFRAFEDGDRVLFLRLTRVAATLALARRAVAVATAH